jgi:ankyrin repeat protein
MFYEIFASKTEIHPSEAPFMWCLPASWLFPQVFDSVELALRDKENKFINVVTRTPLHFAASIGRPLLIELFLTYDRRSADALDNDGRTALHIAAMFGHQVAMLLNIFIRHRRINVCVL